MAAKQGRSKKPRGTHAGRSVGSEIKTGHRGARRTRMDVATLVRMGKGQAHNLRHQTAGWAGVSTIGRPYDPAQAELNYKLGYCH